METIILMYLYVIYQKTHGFILQQLVCWIQKNCPIYICLHFMVVESVRV